MSSHLPYFTSCADVLAKVYEFLDNELAEADCGKIQEHLDECGPCLKEFGLDRMVKDVVKRGCGCESKAPQGKATAPEATRPPGPAKPVDPDQAPGCCCA